MFDVAFEMWKRGKIVSGERKRVIDDEAFH
jgi:hypothetical protein